MMDSADNRIDRLRETRPPTSERDLLNAALDAVRERLPESWLIEKEPAERNMAGRVDASARLRAPDGQEVTLLFEAKRLINTRDVPALLDSLQQAVFDRPGQNEVLPVLVARYLSPATRAQIVCRGAGYVDATGNLRLGSDRPAIWLADRGLDRDPWRGPGRPRGSLKGPPAARVVRALIDYVPPYTVPELTKKAGSSSGVAYRVVKFLEEENLLTRESNGPIIEVCWRELLERWSRDYGFAQSNTVRTFLEPRGLESLVERLTESDLNYVVSGTLAAERVAAYAPARLATIYVQDPSSVASVLDLRPADTGANVALATGDYDVVYDRSETFDGLRVAALSQVAVDLLSGPGRNPSEAEALLDWMVNNESSWRR